MIDPADPWWAVPTLPTRLTAGREFMKPDPRQLIAARIGRGPGQLTQDQAALISGVAQPDISAYLNGRRNLRGDRLLALAEAVGLELRARKRVNPASTR